MPLIAPLLLPGHRHCRIEAIAKGPDPPLSRPTCSFRNQPGLGPQPLYLLWRQLLVSGVQHSEIGVATFGTLRHEAVPSTSPAPPVYLRPCARS
eukprot:1479880-Heterocapsa_arctica.AAC.1